MNVETLKARLAAGPRKPERGDHDLNPDMHPGGALKPAAVLIGVVTHAQAPTIVLTRRTDHLAHHPGQISFPGGHIDPEDATPEDAALREADEEIGLPADKVTLIGRLDRYVTRTGFSVTPVVGLIRPPFTPRPDPHEVADVFEVPLSFLLDPANHQRHARMIDGVERRYYAMPYGEHFIWGATAGMLVNLYERLGNERGDQP